MVPAPGSPGCGGESSVRLPGAAQLDGDPMLVGTAQEEELETPSRGGLVDGGVEGSHSPQLSLACASQHVARTDAGGSGRAVVLDSADQERRHGRQAHGLPHRHRDVSRGDR